MEKQMRQRRGGAAGKKLRPYCIPVSFEQRKVLRRMVFSYESLLLKAGGV